MARSSHPRRPSRRRVAAGLGALALPALVACNGILGLSDYEKVDCAGGRCGDGGLPDVLDPDVLDTGADVIDESRGAGPTSWAQWPMPNYASDAGFLPNPLSYEAVSPDARRDLVTQLVWKKQITAESASHEAAKAACAALATNGPWRLPTRIELVTLLDFGQKTGPFVDPGFAISNVKVWTSSELRPFDPNAPSYWVVDFESGVVQPRKAGAADRAAVLCVKAKG
ncbi:MAG: hypothetical protein JWP97_2030 [Labilithrix sp.]|nr:hypothetical protein [Labilithrix sp.]